MKKDIQLCAVGNALVDLQFEVSDENIKELGLNKGNMQLAEIPQQKELLQKMIGKKANKCSGGSAANTVIGYKNFGGSAAYITLLGDDDNGNFYANEFEEIGIELSARKLDTDPTGTCVVLITPDAERTMHTCLAATSKIDANDVNEDIIARSEWLYIEGYLFSSDNGFAACQKAIEYAEKHNTKISVTFSDQFIVDIFFDRLKEVADKSDLIFCNEGEAKSFAKKEDSNDAYKFLCENYKNVAMTLGAEGSLLRWNGNDYKIKPEEADPIDTTGAGDMFAGAYLYGIINNGNPEFSGKLASLASAKVVSQMGARLEADYKMLINHVESSI